MDKYHAGADLVPGRSISLRRVYSPDWENSHTRALFTAALSLPQVEREQALADSILAEKNLLTEIEALLENWAKRAGHTRLLQEAKCFYERPVSKGTFNCWVQNDGGEHISNAVYTMHLSRKRVRRRGGEVYYASWSLRLNLPFPERPPYYVQLANHTRKSFPSRNEAWSYLDRQRELYADLFTEEYPPIPSDYADCFYFHGVLPAPYQIEQSVRRFMLPNPYN